MAAVPTTPTCSPFKAMTGSAFLAAAGMRVCVGCKQECPAQSMSPWGKSGYMESTCKNNYNRQIERCRSNTRLKTWWKDLSDEQRTDWYVRNKASYVPGGIKAFDNPGYVEEIATTAVQLAEESLYNYLPLDDWCLRQIQLGYCGDGTKAEQRKIATASFQAHIMDKTKKSKQIGGIWCVGVFAGGVERVSMIRQKATTKKEGRSSTMVPTSMRRKTYSRLH